MIMIAPSPFEQCLFCHKPEISVAAQPQSLKERVCQACLQSLRADYQWQSFDETPDFST